MNGLIEGELAPGEYAALCFLPEGSTFHDDGSFGEGTGMPHFMQGMFQTFDVVDA